jgi:hypothetical protein
VNNFALFICGSIVALISGLGILVYMVSVGYEDRKKTLERKKTNEARMKEKIDADLGAIPTPSVVKPESIVIGIPSVS